MDNKLQADIYADIKSEENIVYNIVNVKKFVIYIFGYSNAIIIGRTTSNGELNYDKVGSPNIEITTAQGAIGIKNGGAGTCNVRFVFM